MNISFDLDSTLIPNGNEFEIEKRNSIARIFGIEKIRLGSYQLISDLQQEGHNIHVYTTSFRSKRKIRWTLRYYGIKVDRIVNQAENRRVLTSRNIYASKYPPAFNFDIHIDDLKGVGIESDKFNFSAVIVNPADKDWIENVKKEIAHICKSTILKSLLQELWFQSNKGSENIENIWFSIQEVAKSTGNTREAIRNT